MIDTPHTGPALSASPRFYLPADTDSLWATLSPGQRIPLPEAIAHHASRVLRLRAGAALTLFNGRGGEYQARFEPGEKGSGSFAQITQHQDQEREARLGVTLIQGLCAHDKTDWLLEKCVEAGVSQIIFVPTQRSVVRLEPEKAQKRLQRWRDLTIAACCQCGRNRLPQLNWAPKLSAALALSPAQSQRWVLDPQAHQGLRATSEQNVSLLIGPEGGLTQEELAQAVLAGFEPARLGARVLRTETAGLLAIGALLALHGEFS